MTGWPVFEPDSRVVLMDQLRPPTGYRLESAVATTFTLHLATALVAPLAFASYDMRTRDDPIAALEAVRACADRMDIFCQAGQIAVPAQASDLMAFLEPMVHPVRRPRPGFLFHPKVWFLRYTADDRPDAYRLLCSTRNLADSRAWDAVVTLDGVDTGHRRDENRPLAALLRQLPRWTVNDLSQARRARVDDLAERAHRIAWTLPEAVQELHLHAFGVPRHESQADFRGYRHLVVSPFLDDSGVRHVLGGNPKNVALVSRPEALDALGPDLLAGLSHPAGDAAFVLDPLAGFGLTDLEEPATDATDSAAPVSAAPVSGDPDSELVGLHAKMTVLERGWRAHVFIGSANATSAAYGGNVEFVVEMVGRPKDLGVETMMGLPKDGQPNFRSLIQTYAPDSRVQPPEPDEARRRLENLLRTLAAIAFTTHVESDDLGYRLHLASSAELPIPADHRLQLALLTRPGVAVTQQGPGACSASFERVALPDVTPFVTLRLTDGTGLSLSTVIHAPLHNDPPHRLDEVLARQVNSPEKFLRFLALLLGLGDPTALLAGTGCGAEGGRWEGAFGRSTGVFELVMAALADRPEALVDLDRLVTRLRATEAGRTILPDGFDEFWSAVTGTLATVLERP